MSNFERRSEEKHVGKFFILHYSIFSIRCSILTKKDIGNTDVLFCVFNSPLKGSGYSILNPTLNEKMLARWP